MPKLNKKRKHILEKHDFEKTYLLKEGIQLLKETSCVNFDASVDAAVRLGVNPQKAEQMVRGAVPLPHGSGKNPIILALCTPDKEQEAKQAGADHVGLQEYLTKIEQGWLEIDIIVTTPMLMTKIAKLGKILGPRGLMPSPKTSTVTLEIGKAIKEIKSGKVTFKVDKYGIVHTSVGRVSFLTQKLADNTQELLDTLIRLKPATAKGTYIKSITLSSTMGPGIHIDKSTFI